MQVESQCVSAISVVSLSQIEFLPVDTEKLTHTTTSDPVLSQVMSCAQHGWPTSIDSVLRPYANHRHELSIEVGCLMWGM